MADEIWSRYTVMGSPLVSSSYRNPKEMARVRDSLDYMLDKFAEGMGGHLGDGQKDQKKTDEAEAGTIARENEAIAYLDRQSTMTAQLKHAGLLDRKLGRNPSVQEMMDAGRNVIIVGDDGKPVTYTDKFFKDNPTVKNLLEHEKKTQKPMGNLMAAHMSMFLGERQQNFPGMKKCFGGLNVVDARKQNKSTAYLLTGDRAIVSVIDASAYSAFKNLDQAVREKQEDYDYQENELPKKPEPIGERPEVPRIPRERNWFRRFICRFGFPHSREYNDALAVRNQAEIDQRAYDQKKPGYDHELNEYTKAKTQLDNTKQELDQLEEKLHNNPGWKWKEKVLQTARDRAEIILPFMDRKKEANKQQEKMANAAKQTDAERDMEKFRRDIPGMILSARTIKTLQDSAIQPLQPGSLNLMLELIHNKGTGISMERMQDDLLRSIDPDHSVRLAGEAVNKNRGLSHQAEKSQKEYLKLVSEDYRGRVNNSRYTFYQVFGKEPTVENVKTVMKVTGFEKHLEKYLHMDMQNYNERNKLPEITEDNVDDMTHLLMTGLRSSVELNRQQEIAKPKDVAGESILEARKIEEKMVEQAGKEVRLAVYDPNQQAGHQGPQL